MNRPLQSITSRINLAMLLVGIVLVVLAIWADLLGLDMTPGFGLVQTLSLLAGITMISAAGYWFLARYHPHEGQPSLLSDVGLRLGLTGLLVCAIAGLADMVGIGTHRGPSFERPFLGPLQLGGMILGVSAVAIGLLLFWLGSPSRQSNANAEGDAAED